MGLHEEYFAIQKEYEQKYGENTVVMLQKGSFYEVWGLEDGKTKDVAKIANLQHTFTNKSQPGPTLTNPYMVGIPKCALKTKVQPLIEADYTLVIVDQDPRDSTNRFVKDIWTPSTYVSENQSKGTGSCCLVIEGDYYGISSFDSVTGESEVHEAFHWEDAFRIIATIEPREIVIYSKHLLTTEFKSQLGLHEYKLYFPDNHEIWKPVYHNELLGKVFQSGTLTPIEYLDLERKPMGSTSYAALIDFIYHTNSSLLKNLSKPSVKDDEKLCVIHNNGLYQLNIIPTQNSKGKIKSLFDVVNFTSTPMGRRSLKQLLLRPSCSYEDLCNQYEEVINMFNTLEHHTKYLRGIPDLEKLHRKVALKTLEPSELHNLLVAYENIQMIVNGTEYQDDFNEMLTFCLNRFNLTGLQNDGVYYNIGINEELDRVYKKREELKKKLNSESIRLSQILDIPDSVKWEYAKGDCNMYATPARTNQLKKKEQSISSKKSTTQKEIVISEKINNLTHEYVKVENQFMPLMTRLFGEDIEYIQEQFGNIMKKVCEYISHIDVIKSKATMSKEYNWTRPIITDNESAFIESKGLRHAIIEKLDTDTPYIPNNVSLNAEHNGLLLYGYNGAGKSCYAKSIGLSIVLAQTGHWVPAAEYSFSPFNRLFTRTRGDDDLFKGRSSFEIEMIELKSILDLSDQKTITLGDEVCKGTETASATGIVCQTIHTLTSKKSKFVLATHLHQITKIKDMKDIIKQKNLLVKHIAVAIENNVITFSRELKDGQGDANYGIEMAKYILNNDDFIQGAITYRNEMLGKRTKPKVSIYNSSSYVGPCEICGSEEEVEQHHIAFQSASPELIKDKSNLVNLCKEHHDAVHAKRLIIKGWLKTTDGKKLDFSAS